MRSAELARQNPFEKTFSGLTGLDLLVSVALRVDIERCHRQLLSLKSGQ